MKEIYHTGFTDRVRAMQIGDCIEMNAKEQNGYHAIARRLGYKLSQSTTRREKKLLLWRDA